MSDAHSQDILSTLEIFSGYSVVWELDQKAEIAEFMKSDPNLSEFEHQLRTYDELEKKIHAEPEHLDVGPIALYTGNYK